MAKTSSVLRLFSDLLNSVLLIYSLFIKEEHNLLILFLLVIVIATKIIADLLE